jgi:hypothetical protein
MDQRPDNSGADLFAGHADGQFDQPGCPLPGQLDPLRWIPKTALTNFLVAPGGDGFGDLEDLTQPADDLSQLAFPSVAVVKRSDLQ